MLSPLRFEVMEGMVRDEVRLQLDKLQLRMVEKMQEQVKLHVDQLKVKTEETEQGPQGTRHPARSIFIRKDIFKAEVLGNHRLLQENKQEESQSLLASAEMEEESQSLLALSEMEVDADINDNLQR